MRVELKNEYNNPLFLLKSFMLIRRLNRNKESTNLLNFILEYKNSRERKTFSKKMLEKLSPQI
jgi:hypothetical protein